MNAQTAWPQAIRAITLFTEDLEQTKAFYQRVFDLPIFFEDADSAVFKFGDVLINLLRVREADELISPAKVANQGDGSRFVLTIPVDDVDAMSAELVSRGVTLLNGPLDRPWGTRTTSFMDPAGCIWEITE
jgi:catechol 2,3-dioxygenase-like lactoylglutathione lyase family enzyme